VKIVSSVFDGKSEPAKQDIVWNILRSKLGQYSQGVSLVLVYGLDEVGN
jgi:stress-induced morphogen